MVRFPCIQSVRVSSLLLFSFQVYMKSEKKKTKARHISINKRGIPPVLSLSFVSHGWATDPREYLVPWWVLVMQVGLLARLNHRLTKHLAMVLRGGVNGAIWLHASCIRGVSDVCSELLYFIELLDAELSLFQVVI